MKIISGIINIAVGLFIALFAHTALSNYFFENKEEVKKYELLLKNGISTDAYLDTTYTETTIKIKGIESKFYEVNYTFDTDDSTYNGSYSFRHLDSLESDMISIYYLKDDPTINAANVEEELEKAKTELASKSDLWFGLGLSLASLLLIFSGIRKFIKKDKVV